MIVTTGIVRAFFAAQAVFWLIIGALWARERWRRAGRVIDEAALDVAVRRHPAGSKLPGPDRPQPSGAGDGDDTGVMDALNRDYFDLLDKEKGRG